MNTPLVTITLEEYNRLLKASTGEESFNMLERIARKCEDASLQMVNGREVASVIRAYIKQTRTTSV